LVELSIAALAGTGEQASQAAIARVSTTIDSTNPSGVSESVTPILNNGPRTRSMARHW